MTAMNSSNSPDEILAAACEILKQQPVRIDHRRGWAHFWCPFHPDAERRGRTGRPNFGVNLEEGFWNCFVCSAKGPSLRKLAEALGVNYEPPPAPQDWQPKPERRHGRVAVLHEAMAAARAGFLKSPALAYVKSRGVGPYVAAVYGLGYGHPTPYVERRTALAARDAGLMLRDGTWLWAGSVVYADPPEAPVVINARYLPGDSRPFPVEKNHRTWGERLAPLGSWRIRPETRAVIVVEGLFDMLVAAQEIERRALWPEVCVVYTNGASPARPILDWFGAHDLDYILLPDPDPAGEAWLGQLVEAVGRGDGRVCAERTPDGLDPDEAFLSGWWPSVI